jgi:Ala-tRNA(Pro) deacylase
MNDGAMSEASRDVLAAIRGLLSRAGIEFTEKQHEPTFTSEESARARGEPLEIGAKALVLKADETFRLLVLPANRKLDSSAVKRHLGVKKLRFADASELADLTGLVPGSVPPFGPPVLELPLVADVALLDNEKMAFNAGSLTDSIIMRSEDYRRVAGAEWGTFAVAR